MKLLPTVCPVLSIQSSQESILRSIYRLHCPNGFDADLTFGNGGFWRGEMERLRPKIAVDVEVLRPFAGMIRARSDELPFRDGSWRSAVFDPPFLTYVRNGRSHVSRTGKPMRMAARFGGYWTYEELLKHYVGTLREAMRVLSVDGVLVFKCQDIVHNHRLHCTHAEVIREAEDVGFRLLDLFVLMAKRRWDVRKTQVHARIAHSYFLVFKKPHSLGRVRQPLNKLTIRSDGESSGVP